MGITRQQKRKLNNRRRLFAHGRYFIDGFRHPMVVTETEYYYGWTGRGAKWAYYRDNFHGLSLLNGRIGSYSLNVTDPWPITKDQAEEMARVYADEGYRVYLKRFFGMTDDQVTQYEDFMNEWGWSLP